MGRHIHEVVQGECLSSIAKQYRFGNWRTIYDHPDNAGFKQKRPNPNLIFPGDEIFIPDRDLRDEPGATEKRHQFRIKVSKTLLRLRLTDRKWQPLAWQRYELVVKGDTYEMTDGRSDGILEHEIPADAEKAGLTVWFAEGAPFESLSWTLKLGHLDPVSEISGVQARLNNLGLPCGEVQPEPTPEVSQAISEKLKDFQKRTNLEPDGKLNDQSRERLEQQHDKLKE